jgi:hypothetical protein
MCLLLVLVVVQSFSAEFMKRHLTNLEALPDPLIFNIATSRSSSANLLRGMVTQSMVRQIGHAMVK